MTGIQSIVLGFGVQQPPLYNVAITMILFPLALMIGAVVPPIQHGR
jgi:hypothetical protein